MGSSPTASAQLIPWSSGDDFWPTPRQRWFESIRDHSFKRPGTPTGRATRLKPECLRVRLPPWAHQSTRLGRQSADHLGLEPARSGRRPMREEEGSGRGSSRLWVRVPPEPLTTRPRGAVRSARHPVTVEIVGSNPIEDAYRQVDAVRNLAKRRSSYLRGLWVRDAMKEEVPSVQNGMFASTISQHRKEPRPCCICPSISIASN